MAKQNGILRIQGTLENLTFYKSADGLLVRTRGGVSKERIASDPAFARTRENGAEFAHSAQAGKMLRHAMSKMVFKAKDRHVSSRLLKVMSELKNLDSANVRGQRNVSKGLTAPNATLLLKGFDFNSRSPMQTVLSATPELDLATGTVTLTDLNPIEELRAAEGATHFSMQSAFLNLDFSTGIAEVQYSPLVTQPIAPTAVTVTLTPAAVPAGGGTQMYFLLVEFFQEVNGMLYHLNNGGSNALSILEVV